MSELGDMAKEGFSQHMDMAGGPIIIHKNYGWPQHSFCETKGFKGEEKKRSVFVFSENESVQKGDVIQAKGARDFWRVTETEDQVIGGERVSLLAFIEKEGVSRQQPPASVIINNHNSPGANFHLGNGSIQQSWMQLMNQKIDNAAVTPEEKQKAKSLLTQISENKLLNTIIGSAVGELTKAALPK
jgi:hypothetical protein